MHVKQTKPGQLLALEQACIEVSALEHDDLICRHFSSIG
jgi:hypothetical protein